MTVVLPAWTGTLLIVVGLYLCVGWLVWLACLHVFDPPQRWEEHVITVLIWPIVVGMWPRVVWYSWFTEGKLVARFLGSNFKSLDGIRYRVEQAARQPHRSDWWAPGNRAKAVEDLMYLLKEEQ